MSVKSESREGLDVPGACPSRSYLQKTKQKQIHDFLEGLPDQDCPYLSQHQPDTPSSSQRLSCEIRPPIKVFNKNLLYPPKDFSQTFSRALRNTSPYPSLQSPSGIVSSHLCPPDVQQQVQTFYQDSALLRDRDSPLLQNTPNQEHFASFETQSHPSDTEDQHLGLRVDLTRENLRLYSQSENISLPLDAMSTTSSSAKPIMTGSPRSGKAPNNLCCSEAAFDLQLRAKGIMDTLSEPYNLSSIKLSISATRTDLPGISKYAYLSELVSKAPNKTTLAAFVLSSIFEPYGVSESLRMVFDGQWTMTNPLARLPAPKPDVTIGASIWETAYIDTALSLETLLCPVVCCPELMVPTFTVEAKCFQHPEYAARQNRLNGAIMLRNIQEIHQKAANVTIRSIQVFTGTITNVQATLSVHTCDLGPGGPYYSFCLKKWMLKGAAPDVWEDVIHSFRNAADESVRVNKESIELSLGAMARVLNDGIST
ncbi:hypothetical protein DTO271G3_7240 [Paecilomyces variotii]|nr:hypothetical protein DTO271G3_7240 [Paecilomyces variotii]